MSPLKTRYLTGLAEPRFKTQTIIIQDVFLEANLDC